MPVYVLFKHVVLLKNGKSKFTFGLNATENTHYSKKSSNKSFSASNFIQKSPRGHVFIFPLPRVELEGVKDAMVEILNCTETEKYIHFWAERCRRDALFQKKLQIKVFWHRISFKKVCKGIWVKLWDCSVQPKSECIFPFLYNVIFQPYHLSSPLAPLWREIDMPSWTFSYEIRCQKIFIWSFFWNNAYFWQRSAQKWIYFSHSLICPHTFW